MRVRTIVLLCLLVSLPSGPAAAQPDAALVEEAQRLVDAGMERFRAEAYDEALTLFLRAQELSGDTRIHYPIGRCHEELGDLPRAIAAFEAFVAGDIAPDERGRAEATLRRLRERVATGRVVVQVVPFGATVLVDGRAVGTAPIAPLELSPGRHEIRARSPGHREATQVVAVSGGAETTVAFELETLPDEPPPLAETLPQPPPEEPPSRYTPWTWVTLGSGLALTAGGTIAYVLGEMDHRTVADTEGYGTGAVLDMTWKRAHDLEEAGDAKKLTGYVLWGVGGAALVTSTVLFVLDATDGPSSDVTVVWGPAPNGGVLTLGGRF